MTWFKRKNRIDPDDLIQKAEDSIAQTDSQEARVNRVTNWLVTRKDKNGFGDDFEYTLRPKDIPGRGPDGRLAQ